MPTEQLSSRCTLSNPRTIYTYTTAPRNHQQPLLALAGSKWVGPRVSSHSQLDPPKIITILIGEMGGRWEGNGDTKRQVYAINLLFWRCDKSAMHA